MEVEQPAPEARHREMNEPPAGPLRPFSGTIVSGITFASGHSCWYIDFETTPTAAGSYNEVWVIAPDGTRRLYSDTRESIESVLRYHAFDETTVATIEQSEPADASLRVRVDGEDGTSLALDIDREHTMATRLLTGISRLTPSPVLRTTPGQWLGTTLFAALGGATGSKIAGHTETGSPTGSRVDRLPASRLPRPRSTAMTSERCRRPLRITPSVISRPPSGRLP